MNALLSASAGLFQTHDAWQWLFLLGVLVLGGADLARVWRAGRGTRGLVARIEAGLERVSHLAAWAAAGLQLGLWALGVAFLGFVWDVAWHADTGRDRELFTVPHMLILVGLGGIFAAGVLSIALATRSRVAAGWRVGRLHVPFSSLPLTLVGFGALVGFPLDDYWHTVYGIDVTMWSPTHLLMIGGASLAPLAIWLMVVEGGGGPDTPAAATWRRLSGAALIGLSTFQLEYDMGIPQWQLLFHPALIAAAAAIVLVAARVAFGRGGALIPAVAFLLARGLIAALIGPGFGYVLPHFPLYLGEALCVEAAFWLLAGRAPLVQGLVAGALVGTAGLATEWAWVGFWFPHPWPANLLNDIWIAVVIAVAGGVVGVAGGRVLARRDAGVPAVAVVASLLVIGALLAWHLPLRQADGTRATIHTQTAGATTLARDLDGQITLRRNVNLTLTLAPATAGDRVDWLTVVAWQGRAPVRDIALVRTGPGTYRAAEPIPTGGSWKSLIFLARGDVVEAVPVQMPPDPQYGLPGIEAPASRTQAFVPASHYLMRESHGGVIWPAALAMVVFALMVVLWAATLATAYWRFSLGAAGGPPPEPRARRRPVPRPAL